MEGCARLACLGADMLYLFIALSGPRHPSCIHERATKLKVSQPVSLVKALQGLELLTLVEPSEEVNKAGGLSR